MTQRVTSRLPTRVEPVAGPRRDRCDLPRCRVGVPPGAPLAAAPGGRRARDPADGILRGVYVGAAGMLHALGRLAEAGLHVPTVDGAAVAAGLHEAALARRTRRARARR